MTPDLRDLTPGSLTDELFNLILEGVDIHTEATIAALRDHLVVGMRNKDAAAKHGVAPSTLSRRLKLFHDEAQRLDRLVRLLAPAPASDSTLQDTLREIERRSQELAALAHEARMQTGLRD